MDYATESAQLDAKILAYITSWHRGVELASLELDQLFLEVARYQARYNRPYEQYLSYRDYDLAKLSSPLDIPALPADAFKDAQLSTNSSQAQACFRTSGTTMKHRGCHLLETTRLYEASALAIFDRLVLTPRQLHSDTQLHIISLAPPSHERPDSSLGFMVDHLMRHRSKRGLVHLLHGDNLLLEPLRSAVHQAHEDQAVLCLFTTALGALQLLDALGAEQLILPPRSLVIETGGFKGQSKATSRITLYARLAQCFGISEANVLAEFGMTELTSQYYDSFPSSAHEARVKVGPPWLRTIIRDADGKQVTNGTIGALRHLDLTNRSSLLAIDTEDLGYACGDGFVFLGRERGAHLRGCSLDAEHLRSVEANP